MRSVIGVLILGIALSPSMPQTAMRQTSAPAIEEASRASAARVEQLASRFAALLAPTADERAYGDACARDCSGAGATLRAAAERDGARRRAAMNALAIQIHREVDRFIVDNIHSSVVGRLELEKILERVLGAALVSHPPVVFVSGPDGQRRLAISYTLSKGGAMGPGGTSVTLRMFRERAGRFVFADASGTELDGHTDVSTTVLRPSRTNEDWFLLSGLMTGANGPNTGIGVFRFDGRRFRTAWRAENVWGRFTVSVHDGGFTVEGENYPTGERRRDEYVLTRDGVRKKQAVPLDILTRVTLYHKVMAWSPGKNRGAGRTRRSR